MKLVLICQRMWVQSRSVCVSFPTNGGRDEALSKAASLGPDAAMLKWALGGPAPNPAALKKADPGVAVAASRAREPRGVLRELETLNSELSGPDGVSPAEYRWEMDDEVVERHRLRFTIPQADNATGVLSIDLHHEWGRGSERRCYIAWRNLFWPANPDAVLIRGASQAMGTVTRRSPIDEFITSLLDADRPFSDVSRLALAVGLLAEAAEVKHICFDVLIESIEDGRLDAKSLAAAFTPLAKAEGWIKFNRLAANFSEAARVSPLHMLFVARCIDRLIADAAPIQRDVHNLLSLQHELLMELGLPLSPGARTVLQSVKGSSKTARLAKALINHEPIAPTAAFAEAVLRGAETRIERAERWAELY